MKFFDEIKNCYKLNLITSGRHFMATGNGWIRLDGQKFVPGKYYVFTDVFVFGKGSKAYEISLRDTLIVGKPKVEG